MKRKLKDFWWWLTEKEDGYCRLESILFITLAPPTFWFLTVVLFSFE